MFSARNIPGEREMVVLEEEEGGRRCILCRCLGCICFSGGGGEMLSNYCIYQQ